MNFKTFAHVFKYKIIYMLHEPFGLFWLIAFPIILATLFYSAFGKLGEEAFEPISIAVVDSSADEQFCDMLEATEMFIIEYTDADTAQTLLADGKITGFISVGDNYSLSVAKSSLYESMTKYIVDTYIQTTATVTDIIMQNPELLQTEFLSNLNTSQEYISERSLKADGGKVNQVIVFFYSIIGMTAIMGGTHAIEDVSFTQANQSPQGARVCVSSAKKTTCFSANISATILFEFLIILLTLAYISFVLKISMAENIGYILLLAFVAVLTGTMFGTLVCTTLKISDGSKNGIIIAFTMLGSFLSGMMTPGINYYISVHAPIVAYLNPVNLITDSMYTLYYYGVTARYFLNLTILAVMAIACAVPSFIIMRREKYASI